MSEYEELRHDPTIERWFKRIHKRPQTEKAYLLGMHKYIKFTAMTPAELIAEAKQEQKEGVDMDERMIINRRVDFRYYLQTETNYAPHTIQSILRAVDAFYRGAYLEVPKLLGNEAAESKKENVRFITKDEIRDLLEVCDELERAVVLIGISSGLSAIDIINLRIKISKTGYDPDTEITTLHLKRTKTGVEFTTFFTPETSRAVWQYLKYRRDKKPSQKSAERLEQAAKQHITSDEGYLFVVRRVCSDYIIDCPPHNQVKNEELRKFSTDTFTRMYLRLAEKCQKINPEGWNVVRSHNMRKFFNNTLRNAEIDRQFCEHMMGHKLNRVEGAYLNLSPEVLKEKYKSCIPYLTIYKDTAAVDTKEYQELAAERDQLKTKLETVTLERYELEQLKKQLEKYREILDDLAAEEYEKKQAQEYENRDKYLTPAEEKAIEDYEKNH